MIIPVDREDLLKLMNAASARCPEIVAKYQISDLIENSRNVIEFDLSNVIIKMYDGAGRPVSEGNKDCMTHRFSVHFAGLSEEDNLKITSFIEKVELPVLDYGICEIAKTKVTFYNVNNDSTGFVNVNHSFSGDDKTYTK